MASKTTVNQQIRSFALVWTAITFMVGVAVFFAIYLTYDTVNPALAASSDDVALPESDTSNDQGAQPQNAAQPELAVNTPIAQLGGLSPEDAQATALGMTPLSAFANQPTATNTPVPPIYTSDQFFVGVQVQPVLDGNPDLQRTWFNDARGLGVSWIKEQVRWAEIETADNVFDWSVLDLTLPIAQEYGFNVMLSVVAAPDWARDPGVDLTSEGPPADYQQFAEFLTVLVQRYPGLIHAIELWNESNLDREWMSTQGVDAADFVRLTAIGAQAVKNVDPNIIIISGALSPTGGWAPDGVLRAMDDFDYLDQAIAAGLLNYVDCIGVHHNGYNISPSYRWNEVPNDPTATFRGPFDNAHHTFSFRSTLETYANKVAVAGGSQKLCVTEFGWASTEDLEGRPQGFEFADDNTLEEQAEYTVEALRLMKEWGFVWIASIWNLNYGPQAGWATTSDNTPYSLIGPGFSKRPAYGAVAEWIAQNS